MSFPFLACARDGARLEGADGGAEEEEVAGVGATQGVVVIRESV